MYEVEFRKAIGAAIPSLVRILNRGGDDVRTVTVSALTKLADHGEFGSLMCYRFH